MSPHAPQTGIEATPSDKGEIPPVTIVIRPADSLKLEIVLRQELDLSYWVHAAVQAPTLRTVMFGTP